MTAEFALWLQHELDKRAWNQSDLARSATQRGYTLGAAQVSRILNQDQQAGIASVIAIAHGLGISRETVFQARGWLLPPSPNTPLSVTNPSIQRVVRVLLELESSKQEEVCLAMLTLLEAKSTGNDS